MSNDTKELILGFILLILFVVLILGTIQGMYLLKSKLNTSVGKVYCDNKLVYEGRLYRFGKDLETHNLQAPLFSIVIKHPSNFYKVEKSYFCSVLQVTD